MDPLQHQHVYRHRVRCQAHQQVRLVLLESQGMYHPQYLAFNAHLYYLSLVVLGIEFGTSLT